jgi:protein-S-isoprenylcysteine O-methyltransferase Ste14
MKEHKHAHLAGERPGSHTNQIILMVIFFVVWIVDSFLLRYTTFLFETFMWLSLIPGVIILVAAVYFMDRSHKDLFDTETEELATKGVYGRVRNPMYLGTVLFYFGLAVATFSLASLVVCCIIFLYYILLANYEEEKLYEKFGDAFLEYKKHVRKWIPVKK